MIDYLEVFRQQRERVEAQWDIDVKNNSKSSFDAKTFFSEDGMSHCFNAKKYTFEEACELVKSEYGSDFINVSKSYVRHRCGTTEDGKRCGWWCGDDERGYHSVPVWMFCDDEDYTAIEVALAKVEG